MKRDMIHGKVRDTEEVECDQVCTLRNLIYSESMAILCEVWYTKIAAQAKW